MAKGIDYGFSGASGAAFTHWPTGKAAQGGIDCGPKPTQAELDLAAALLTRHGTGRHMALAMYARPDGALMKQVSRVTGDTQVNVLRELVDAGHVVRRPLPGEGNAMRYAFMLPAKSPHLGKATPATMPAKPGKGAAKVTTATPAKGAAKVTGKAKLTPAQVTRAVNRGKASKAAPAKASAAPVTAPAGEGGNA